MTQSPYIGPPSSGVQYLQAPAPRSVKVARVLVFVEAFLVGLLGVLVLVIGNTVVGQTGGTGRRLVIAIAVIVFVLTGLWVWAGIAIGRLHNGARWTAVGLSVLGCLFELIRLGAAPGRSIIGIALGGAVIYLLVFDSSAREAFATKSAIPYGVAPQPQVPYTSPPTTPLPPGSSQRPPF